MAPSFCIGCAALPVADEKRARPHQESRVVFMACKEGSDFFSNRACEYFPCHEGADPEEFNCMFCYCPLYALGSSCGGEFSYTEDGVKSCAECVLPHVGADGVAMVKERFAALVELASR